MKNFFYSLLLSLLGASGTYAQTAISKSSVGIGVERIGLDAPDGLSNRYLVGYARHWAKDRVVLHTTLGYVSALNRRYLVNDAFIDGKRRRRVTGDATLAFDFIRHPRHAFRLGAGPSAWYRQDQKLDGVAFTLNNDGTVSNIRARWFTVEEVNYGFNVLIEYEFALSQRLLLRTNIKFASLRGAGQSTIYGGGLGYRLPQR